MKTLQLCTVSLVFFIVFSLSFSTLSAQSSSIFDRLSGVEVREITLKTNLSSILDSRTEEPEYVPAEMVFDRAGTEERWNLKVRPRGKYRRRVCDFPPLKLNFSKGDLRARGMADFDDIKLVTHCTDDRIDGKDQVLREYLAYLLYQQLSPASYRVQLVRIQYVDTEGRISPMRRYGFIIEDTDEMAARLGGEECESCTNPAPATIDMAAENMHALFQYFIGNTDYSVPMVRNLKFVSSPGRQLVPVGYDFDFSGLVNATYALPSMHLGQLTVQHRIFLGMSAPNEVIAKNIALFRQKRLELLQTVRNFKYVSRESRDEMAAYLDLFYVQLDQLERNNPSLSWYQRLRQEAPYALPAGGTAENYGVVK